MVTSPAAVVPARTVGFQAAMPTPAVRVAARRRAQISALRHWSRAVLIVGTVVSLASAVGPSWAPRLGLGVAIGAALTACLLAWREIGLERRAHAAAMSAAFRRHGERLSQERRHNATVIDALTRRLHASHAVATSRAATIQRLHGDLRRLRGDVNGLRGANSRLTRDLNLRDVTIRELRETVARQRAEQAFPRRPLWGDLGNDLDPELDLNLDLDLDRAERRDVEFLATHAVIAMPNYEDDRRFG